MKAEEKRKWKGRILRQSKAITKKNHPTNQPFRERDKKKDLQRGQSEKTSLTTSNQSKQINPPTMAK